MEHEDLKERTPGIRIQYAAAAAAIAPMAVLTTWMYGVRDSAPSIQEFFLGPMLFGGAMIFWLLYLHIVVCRDDLRSIGFRLTGLSRDVVIGAAMGVGFLFLKFWTDPVLRGLFEARPPSAEMIQLITAVVSDTRLLLLWLGPVVWIGIAGFEELWRVVVLRRFWTVFPSAPGKWVSLVLVSVLIGIAHGYQGPAAILSITMKSILMGWYFMATGRTRALIVAHAVYDSVQIVMAVIAIRQIGL